MKIKDIIFNDLINYKVPCMVIEMPYCSFKCEKECGELVCQNSSLASAETIDISNNFLIKRYLKDDLSKAIVFGGLEPFDSWKELLEFVIDFRKECDDDIVIYTGYTEEELKKQVSTLEQFPNIIIKFGRFIPHQNSHYDKVLCVDLASPNQYGKKIS
jgi:hypothetical protein